MHIGVIFPQTEFGNDPALIKDYAQTVEALGFSHLTVYDHVLGADHTDRDPPLTGPYTESTPFHEPFVFLSYLAAVTTTLELTTGVIILPQRQAALVAKQAAELAVLSGNRFRLGVGTGWNYVEYEALNEDYATRGARMTEQVEVMRQLWERDTVDYRGKWHRIDRAGILPRPSRSVPVWFGGLKAPALRRAVQMGDGFVFGRLNSRAVDAAIELRDMLAASGRDSDAFGLDAIVSWDHGPDSWAKDIERWRAAGGTHASVQTMNAGLSGPERHMSALREYAEGIGLTR